MKKSTKEKKTLKETGPLTFLELDYIRNHPEINVTDMAKILNRTRYSVDKATAEIRAEQEAERAAELEAKLKEEQEAVNKPVFNDSHYIFRRPEGNTNLGGVTKTGGAFILSDSSNLDAEFGHG